MNGRGVPCDLVTGEERRMAREDGEPSSHVACTVEMTNGSQPYEVAVIDEIQLTKDFQRGWAWTRALLGVQAEEVHLCGEAAAVDLIRELCISTGEEVEVRHYKRLTKLVVEETAVETVDNIKDGDCIVCFNKQDIYSVSRALEAKGKEVAVIYGSLPPNAKLAMAKKFNDPVDPCRVMVATDAVGMGLNLNIRRMVFYSVNKMQLTKEGEREVNLISVSQALQIAGRAGRFGTEWDTGYVTTFRREELPMLQKLLQQVPEELLQAGLHPTFDQLELYAYHLPAATLSNLVDIFVSLSTLDDSMYSLCQLDDFKFLADVIEHIKLPLKAKYTFCCAPINRKMPFVCAMFLKKARQYSKGELITFDWLCGQVGWPFSPPETILDLVHLEQIHDVFDLYLWLSYRFPDMFPDVEIVRQVQQELDTVVEEGVANLVKLLKNSESPMSRR
jgi:ATP-dependent RNA helicase SUPV3L1/SUV3